MSIFKRFRNARRMARALAFYIRRCGRAAAF